MAELNLKHQMIYISSLQSWIFFLKKKIPNGTKKSHLLLLRHELESMDKGERKIKKEKREGGERMGRIRREEEERKRRREGDKNKISYPCLD